MVENLEVSERASKSVIESFKEETERLHRTVTLQSEKIKVLESQAELLQSELSQSKASETVALKVAHDAAGLVRHHEGVVMGKDQMIETLKDLMHSIVGRHP
jgi:predicted RNase H-like nuclease (RuvC/YqgF family)